jgi:DNA-binding ferritin-like protein (Dps family)
MDIHIPVLTNLQLQEIAKQQGREISDIITDAIAHYVEAHTHETAFRDRVRQAIVQHKWLLDELDKQ